MVVALKDTSLGYAVAAPGLTYVGKQIYGEFRNQVPRCHRDRGDLHHGQPDPHLARHLVQKRFVGEKKVLDVSTTVGGQAGGAAGRDGPTVCGGRDPEPDHALDDDRRRRHGRPRTRTGRSRSSPVPLRRVGLGDAGDVAGRLGGVGDLIPFGIHRLSGGMLTSASAPMAASRPLHSAIACTVPRWLWTPRRLGTTSSTRLGSTTVNRGFTVAKYGALRANATENSRCPFGSRDRVVQRPARKAYLP